MPGALKIGLQRSAEGCKNIFVLSFLYLKRTVIYYSAFIDEMTGGNSIVCALSLSISSFHSSFSLNKSHFFLHHGIMSTALLLVVIVARISCFKGFVAYLGFLNVLVAHRHPVMLVFCELLNTKGDEPKSGQSLELSKYT